MQVLREQTDEGKWYIDFSPRFSCLLGTYSPLRCILRSPLHFKAGRSLKTSLNLDWFHYSYFSWISRRNKHAHKAPQNRWWSMAATITKSPSTILRKHKRARWRQSSRVTRNPESQRPPSATSAKYNLSNAMHTRGSQSLVNVITESIEEVGVFAQL
jgi:hypothetical protein